MYSPVLIDFSTVRNLDEEVAQSLNIPCVPCATPLSIQAVDGSPLGTGTGLLYNKSTPFIIASSFHCVRPPLAYHAQVSLKIHDAASRH